MPSTLIRTVRFSAGHRYARPEWSEARNREVFGRAADPHGHNYSVRVTVRGEIADDTGFVVDLASLDAVLESRVRSRLDQRDLTAEIPDFAPGEGIPSTEALARWVWDELVDRIPSPARLVHVHVAESDTLAAEYWAE